MILEADWLALKDLSEWELYSRSIKTELRQALDEGRDAKQYEDVVSAVDALPIGEAREEIADALFRAISQAPIREDFPYTEPDDLLKIRLCRPKARRAFEKPVASSMKDKVRGAWYGRIAGCLLGKPVEGWHTPELHEMLRATDNFPLHRYMTRQDLQKMGPSFSRADEKGRTWADELKGCAPVDDDTNYTVLAVKLVETYGRGFAPRNVANAWMDWQPKNAYCTAERRAFRNFVAGIMPPKSAVYKNPDREFIGAQIRADYFGYINPGDPEQAAEMAYRDACISHVKNGIYGEMFVAAMLAAAAVTDDVHAVIEAGLGQIPENCRLAEAVRGVVREFDEGAPQAECFRRIHERWDEFQLYDWVHTIPNAEIVTASLLYGDGDYTRSVCMAVETGFDTDCNGATVGSVFGMMHGARAIGREWTDPLCGTLDTSIFGVGRVSIEEMARTTLRHSTAL
jgi:ADP-ribosylglycohydrolase/plasmid stabilization system protein ParE